MPKIMWDEPHTFVVSGTGEFPWDMLRHSQAWPVSTADALALAHTGSRTVALTGARRRHINPERWASFGWPVVRGDPR